MGVAERRYDGSTGVHLGAEASIADGVGPLVPRRSQAMRSYGMQRFERTRGASGRERLDGYDRWMFATMTEDERRSAIASLKEDALRGDGIAVEALPWADPDHAKTHLLDVFEHSFERLPGPSRVYLVRDLLGLTGDATFMDRLFEFCNSEIDMTRRAAIMLVTELVVGEQMLPHFTAGLRLLANSSSLDATDRARIMSRLTKDGR
jgi:hypothetical protein